MKNPLSRLKTVLCFSVLLWNSTLFAAQPQSPTRTHEKQPRSIEEYQQVVMDFADEYMAAVGEALDDYISIEPDAAKRVAAQSWRVRYTTAAMSIASARDPRMNLLDMVVFISAGKWAVNSYWIPKVFGKNAQPLSEAYGRMDCKIWTITSEVLSKDQESKLRQLIINWEHSHPRMHEVSTARLRNLDGVHLSAFDDGHSAWGILGNVMLLLKRVNKSLLSGERIMFCLNHTPLILAQQSDLTIAQVGDAFPLAAVKPDTIVGAVKGLPSILQEGLDKNQGAISTLLPQLGATLKSADSLAVTLNRSVQTFDGNGRIADPSTMLKDINQALGHLDSSIEGINRLLSNNAPGGIQNEDVARQIDVQGNRLMDSAFHRLLLLIGIFFGGIICILVLIKLLFLRKSNISTGS